MLTQQLVNAASLAGIYVLFALGLSLALGMLRILNLAHGAIYMVGAFAALLISEWTSFPLLVVGLLAACTAALLGVLIDTALLRPVRRRARDPHELELASILVTIGAAVVITALVERRTGGDIRTLPSELTTTTTWVLPGGGVVTNYQVLVVVLALVLTTALAWLLRQSQLGRAFRGVAESPSTSSLLGVNAATLSMVGMMAVSAMAGLAGVLLAVLFGSVHFAMGEGLLLKGIAVVILGGAGHLWGTVVGAVLLALLETLVVAYLSSSLRDVIVFGLILVGLVLRPSGLGLGTPALDRA